MEKTASNICYNLIKSEELFSAKAYKKKGDRWTIGFGHTRTVTANTPDIDMGHAVLLLKEDVNVVEAYINYHFDNLKQCQFDALVSLLFNIGGDEKFLKTRTAHWLKKDPQDRHVAYNWIEFTLSSGGYQRGLLKRRIKELALYYSW